MQKFALNHIKSFEQSKEVEIKPITVFVGKNSCGKSSLLRFPVVLAQTFREDALTPLLLFGNLIDYGNYDDVAYRHDTKPIGFRMTFGPELAQLIRRYRMWRYAYSVNIKKPFLIKNVEIEIDIDKPEKKLQVREIELYIEGKKLCTVNREGNGYVFTVHQIFLQKTWENSETKITALDMDFYKCIPRVDEIKLFERYSEERGIYDQDAEPISEQKLFIYDMSVIVASLIDRCYIKKNAYYNELVSVALSKETEDNIIVMDSKHRIGQKNIKELGISVFDSRDINDVSGNNLFSMYTLPVNGKAVSKGEDSKSIARWLGRFLREENYIQIYDNYLLTEDGIQYLKKYILKYVEEKTEIEIYSLQNEDFSEQQIKDIILTLKRHITKRRLRKKKSTMS